ncbi:VTT domain-containing protein [Candidatus Micrarchaeota archaeon]|nr:VTT domain-containing protein [Candidatus Micrarchaeota archaeon]MBU1929949.1 VTT domain-containing protein [Candidatus Micrarchaeota archaeon]
MLLKVWNWNKQVWKGLYHRIVQYKDSKYAVPALFVLALIESVFFPVPPDVLLIPLAAAFPRRAFYFAGVAVVGSVIGAIIGYAIGFFFFDAIGIPLLESLHLTEEFTIVSQLFSQYGFWIVLAAALTPIPYKVFTITAGFLQLNPITFIVASVLGRGARFGIEGALFFFYGTKIKRFIVDYFKWISIGLLVLLIVVAWILSIMGFF